MRVPSRRSHERLCSPLLGRSYGEVHAFIDRAAKEMGRAHRRVGHDPALDPVLNALVFRNYGAAASTYLHVLQDRIPTSQRLILEVLVKKKANFAARLLAYHILLKGRGEKG